MHRRAAVATILALVILAGASLLPDKGEGAPEIYMVEVEIAEAGLSFDVSFNGSCNGTFHCTATLLLNLGIFTESVDVLLTVEPSQHMSVVLSEYNFTLTPDDPIKEFTAEVTLLHGTPSSLEPMLTIGGSAESQPSRTKGNIIEDSAYVEILPFYGAELSFVEGFGTLKQGGSRTFTLNIINTGNARESFNFIVTNKDELRSRGIKVSMEDLSIDLAEGDSRDIPVKVTAERDAGRGGAVVYLEVYSENNGPGDMEDSRGVLTLTVENAGIDVILGIFSSPLYLWGSLILLVMVAGAAVYVALKVREHLRWKRAVRSTRHPRAVDELSMEHENDLR